MKKGKRKVGFIIGCVALSLLLAVSGYITLVIAGVIADENKNGTLIKTDNTVVTDVNNQNIIVQDENGNMIVVPDINNGGYVDNGYVNGGNANNNLNNGGSVVNNNVNTNQQQGGVTQNPSQTVNNLLDTNKTKADIVNIYATVMNKAKAEKPGFKKVEYQELPEDAANRVISKDSDTVTKEDMDKLLGFFVDLGVFVPKETAEAEPYVHTKGDADMTYFPVFLREKGSYLTDPNGIESYTYKVLPNGNVKMSFVLVSEDNPEPIAENSNVSPSYTGAVFAPMSKERIDGTVYHPIVTVFAKNIKYSLRYHDCSVELEFNPDTLQVVSVTQICNVSIKGSGDVVGVGFVGLERQELISTAIITDLQY
ncbi:MAG: hypothetical protein IKT55_00915 [Clostridia bacterium]|nr:hypothetical protein [Clostridia bacterium]